MNTQPNKTIPRLSQLAARWMAMLEHGCPPDWREMLPTLNLERPDKMLQANPLPILSFLPKMAALAPPDNRAFISTGMWQKSFIFP